MAPKPYRKSIAGEPKPPTTHGLGCLQGVGPSCVSLPTGAWPTIAAFLQARFPTVAPEVWHQRMQAGLVVDAWGQPVTQERPYQAHLRVYYYRHVPHEERIPFEATVLFQDEHVVVADKPHFLPVTPSGHYVQETLLVRLKNQLGLPGLSPIHRIDRETAGLVVFSVRPLERGTYHQLFREKKVHKIYEAIAPWQPDRHLPASRSSRIVRGEPFFRQCEVDGPANSLTHFELLQTHGALGRYRLKPITGQKHQLRLHMYALGRPIVNDRVYPPRVPTPADDYRFPLQLLAQSIAWLDPITGQARHFVSRQQLLALPHHS